MENDNIEQNKESDQWWRPVLFFYVKVTAWIATPAVVAFIVGGKSFYFILVAGFLLTIYGIYREIKIYKKTLK